MLPLLPIRRTATRKHREKSDESHPLSSWHDLDAYVLLGEPGSGKTTVFKQEAESLGRDACYLTAKNFLTLFQGDEWRGETLFIDALDERRSSLGSSTAPLEQLREKLLKMGKPRFRLSCREADWLAGGANDLAPVSPNGNVAELRLDPLDEEGIGQLLTAWLPPGTGTAAEFVEKAEFLGLDAQLHSPLLLKLLINAVKGNQWPDTRHAVFEVACGHMAVEYDLARRDHTVLPAVPKDLLLEAAGKLFALMLLSDSQWLTLDPHDEDAGCILVDNIPCQLGIAPEVLTAVLSSKLFGSEGKRRGPWHRTIAEYLGARAIAVLVTQKGLPIQRAIGLMAGDDGGIVDPLRGLYGWLAYHCQTERTLLIGMDPMGLILYGDVKPFSTTQKQFLLRALQGEAERFPWFRSDDWDRRPFGALGTRDMRADFQQLIESPSRGLQHDAHLECVLDAVLYGEPMAELAQSLYAVVIDKTHSQRIRREAAAGWLKCIGNAREPALRLLDDIVRGNVSDEDNEICGGILTALYPKHFSASDAIRYLHTEKKKNLIGWYHMFWSREFLELMPKEQIVGAVAKMVGLTARPEVSDDCHDGYGDTEAIRRVARGLLVKACTEIGDSSSDEELQRWLRLGINSYGQSESNSDEFKALRSWLTSRPERMKAVYLCEVRNPFLGIEKVRAHPWRLDQCLHHAIRPRDWFQWLLSVASTCTEEEFVKRWVITAAHTAISEDESFDISLEDVERWVSANERTWPSASTWILEATSCGLDDYRGKEYQRIERNAKAIKLKREKRRALFLPLLSQISSGTAPPWAIFEVVAAYNKLSHDSQGEHPLDRIANLLGGDATEAEMALEGVLKVFDRTDLPSIEEIKATRALSKQLFLSPAFLLAGDILFKRDPDSISSWPNKIVELLVAFNFIDEFGQDHAWLKQLCLLRPEDVRRTLQPLAEENIRSSDSPTLGVIYSFKRLDAPDALARACLPGLIRAVPLRPSAAQLRLLNGTLIGAAKRHLTGTELSALVNERLAKNGLSLEYFVALHVAAIEFDPELHLLVLKTLTDQDTDVGLVIRSALEEQGTDWSGIATTSPQLLGWLIELLAECALASGDPNKHESQDPFKSDHRFIHFFTMLLSGLTSSTAVYELCYLKNIACMEPWALQLDWCIGKQQKLVRSSSFAPPGYSQVANVLLNHSPANPRDLMAVMIDQIAWQAKIIRFDDTNQLDLFWQSTGHGVSQPRSENECRDVLQSLLRERLLQLGIQIEKESFAAGDKRADLQCSTISEGKRFVVPIEIKKEDHPGVWTASWDQLEARYTANPAAQGMGVYLVLWFGVKPKPSPDRIKPSSAEQMAQMLGECMPERQWNKIRGLVIDLSRRGR